MMITDRHHVCSFIFILVSVFHANDDECAVNVMMMIDDDD